MRGAGLPSLLAFSLGVLALCVGQLVLCVGQPSRSATHTDTIYTDTLGYSTGKGNGFEPTRDDGLHRSVKNKRCYQCAWSPPTPTYDMQKNAFANSVNSGSSQGGWDKCSKPFDLFMADFYGINKWDCEHNCYTRTDSNGNFYRGCYKGEYKVNPNLLGCHLQAGSLYCFCDGDLCNDKDGAQSKHSTAAHASQTPSTRPYGRALPKANHVYDLYNNEEIGPAIVPASTRHFAPSPKENAIYMDGHSNFRKNGNHIRALYETPRQVSMATNRHEPELPYRDDHRWSQVNQVPDPKTSRYQGDGNHQAGEGVDLYRGYRGEDYYLPRPVQSSHDGGGGRSATARPAGYSRQTRRLSYPPGESSEARQEPKHAPKYPIPHHLTKIVHDILVHDKTLHAALAPRKMNAIHGYAPNVYRQRQMAKTEEEKAKESKKRNGRGEREERSSRPDGRHEPRRRYARNGRGERGERSSRPDGRHEPRRRYARNDRDYLRDPTSRTRNDLRESVSKDYTDSDKLYTPDYVTSGIAYRHNSQPSEVRYREYDQRMTAPGNDDKDVMNTYRKGYSHHKYPRHRY